MGRRDEEGRDSRRGREGGKEGGGGGGGGGIIGFLVHLYVSNLPQTLSMSSARCFSLSATRCVRTREAATSTCKCYTVHS